MKTELAKKITISQLVAFEERKNEVGEQILEIVNEYIRKSQATVLKVDCRTDSVLANDQIGLGKAVSSNIEKKRLEHSRIVMDFRDTNNAWYTEFKNPIDEELLRITTMSGVYQRKCREEERKAEEERQAKIREREAKQEAHRVKGHIIDETPRAELVPEVAPIETVSALKTHWTWKYEILEESKIPREWLCVDTTKIQRAVTRRENPVRDIAGVRIYHDEKVVQLVVVWWVAKEGAEVTLGPWPARQEIKGGEIRLNSK